jgi:2-C-methyl-D-erythritol 2,4-cyclodiphosphate synthase
MRIGHGYDVHRLGGGVPLVLGGVRIPYKCGLIGWSDADVLTHAIIDALLGAAAMGDIGVHFPPGDPQYKGISSLVLLQKVGRMLKDAGYRVEALGCEKGCVNVKASTQEELGFVGREEGMIAWAVALIE